MSATETPNPFRVGDAVTFEGRPSRVVDVSKKRPGILTVENYTGRFMIGATNSKLAQVVPS